ncbi:MAG: PAS domain S-box protein [Nitrospira sp.]|nr:PAS domain S-box protein [Nitrospira sp.]
MACLRKMQTIVSKGSFALLVVILGAALLGAVSVRLVERELITRTGVSLALGAAEVAGKLDVMFLERDGDIHVLAAAPQVLGTDPMMIRAHLEAVQRAYPVYSRLAVVDRAGHVVASTDEGLIGLDLHQASWFQSVSHAPRVHAETISDSGRRGGALTAVVFSAPIKGVDGTFLGAIMTEVDRAIWYQLVEETVHQFSVQAQNFGTVHYQVLSAEGSLLLTSEQDDWGRNVQLAGLPSALKVTMGRSGYVEEEHLIRKVPIISGYARMSGVRSKALQWGLVVRADHADVLASVRSLLIKLGFGGIVGFLLMLAAILWAGVGQRKEHERSKQAERSLRESEMRARSVIESALDAVVMMDREGRIIEWNRPAERIFGWSRQEALGRNLGETIVPPTLREAHANGVRHYLATGEGPVLNQRIEITGLRKNGSEFPVELTILPIKFEGTTIFSAFLRDITERKAMVKQLEEGAVYFRMLSELLPLSLFELDAQGRCLYRNRALQRLLGEQHEDNLITADGSVIASSWTEWIRDDDRKSVAEAWSCMLVTMAPIHLESRLALPGSEPCWVQVSVWPLATDSGLRYLGVMEDITVRKKTIAHTMQLMHHGQFELRTLDEARHLAELLAYAFPDPSRTQLGLTELLVNGVEHGNLGISYDEKSTLLDQGRFEAELIRRSALPEHRDKRVHITVERTDRNLEMTIFDDGSGFDWRQYLDLDHRRADESHGRGIAMAKAVSFDQLDFQGSGNQVVVSVSLNGVDADADAWPEEERRVA